VHALAVLALKLAVNALLGFVAGAILKVRESFLAYVGAGWLGLKLGEWAGEQLRVRDPSEVEIGSQDTPFLFGLAGALLVMLVVRLLRRGIPRKT